MKKRFTLFLSSLLVCVGVVRADFTQAWTSAPSPWTDEEVTDYPAELNWSTGTNASGATITDHGTDGHTVRKAETSVNVSEATDVKVSFQWSGGSHSLWVLGVDIIGADNQVVKSDYALKQTGGAKNVITYTLSSVPAGTYTMRYFICDKNGDHEVTMSAGAITVEGNITIDSDLITSAADLSNDKVYTVSTADRGSWTYSEEKSALTSTQKAGIAVSADDANQQFAFITVKDKVYLYSVGAGKFVVKSDANTTVSADPTEYVELLGSSNGNYPVVVALSGSSQIGISNGYDPAVITFWNDLGDAGNQVNIVEAKEMDLSAVVSAIELYLNAEAQALIADAEALYDNLKNYSNAEVVALGEALEAVKGSFSDANVNALQVAYDATVEFPFVSSMTKTIAAGNYYVYYTDENDVKHYLQTSGSNSVTTVTEKAKEYTISAGVTEGGKYSQAYYMEMNDLRISNTNANGTTVETKAKNQSTVWTSQVVFEKDGKCAIRLTNATAMDQWHGYFFIGKGESEGATIALDPTTSLEEAMFIWQLEQVVYETLTYTLTDALGNVYTGSYEGVAGKTEPVLSGVVGCTYENGAWDGTAFSANVVFPFPVSDEETINATMISSFKNYAENFLWRAVDTGITAQRNAEADSDNYKWAIYPAFAEGNFTFTIKNLGTGKYIYSESADNNHNAGAVTLAEDGSAFTVEANNKFKLATGKYLSLNSGTSNDEQILGTWGDHGGTYNKFIPCEYEPEVEVDPNDYTSYILNADLSTTDAWNAEGTKGIANGYVKVGSGSSFDFSQTITLPAGQYKMTAKAAYRYGGNEQTEYEAIQAGDETHLVKLYAQTATKKYEVNVMNRWEGASDTDLAGEGAVQVNGKYVPNSSSSVKAWFDAGQYINELVFELAEDGEVQIGIAKTESPAAGDYANIGAWTLTRLGDADCDLSEGTWSDATSYIVNADLSSTEGWTITDPTATRTDLRVVEYWRGNRESGKASQTVSLPAGTYRLTGKAFYRHGGGANDAPEKSLGYLFAGGDKVLVKTLASENSGANGVDGASTAFYTNDLYSNVLEFVLTEDATIELGYQCNFLDEDVANSWFIFGGMTLEKKQTLKDNFMAQVEEFSAFGQSSMAMYSLGAVQDKWSEVMAVVDPLYFAVSEGGQALKAEVVAAMELMTTSMAAMKPVLEYYDGTFSDTKWAMYDVQDNSTANSEEVRVAFDDALTAALNVYTVTTVAELEAKVAEMEAARQVYVQNAVPTNGTTFDYTFKIAGVGNTTNGWVKALSEEFKHNYQYNGSATNKNTETLKKTGYIEAWNNGANFTGSFTYKASGLPDGFYKLSAYAFTDGATSLVAGTKSVVVENTGAYVQPAVDSVMVVDGTMTFGLNIEGATWVGITNLEMAYEGALPDSVLLPLKKPVLQEKAKALEAYAVDYSWTMLNNEVFYPVYDAILGNADYQIVGLMDTLDKVTEYAVIEKAIADIDNTLATMDKAYAEGAEYKFFANALSEIMGVSVPFNEEIGAAANEKLEASFNASYSLSTLEAIEEANAGMKAAFASYLTQAAPMEGDTFDMTFFLENPSFETGDLIGWTVEPSSDTNVYPNSNGTYTTTGVDGDYLFNTWWKGNPLTQEVKSLPAGNYVLSALVASDGATVYLRAGAGHNEGINTSDKTIFLETSYAFAWEGGDIVLGVVGGDNGEAAAHKPYREDGYWWYKADNFRLTFVPVIPDSILYKADRQKFVLRAEEFGSFVESNASLTMLSGIKGTYAWPIFDVVDPLVAGINEVTDMELLDSMITVMDEATDTMLQAAAIYDEYMVYRNLLWDAADVSTGFTEEVEAAKDMALENSNYACAMVATIEGLEEKVAEIKAEYLAYVGNAWGDKEGVTFDVTFMAGVTPRAGDSYDATTDAWSASGTSADAPEVTTADGRTAKMIEYNTRADKAKLNSVVMQQTVWNLPNATYNVELYANAISRNYEVAWAEGADPASFVYVSANGVKTPVVAKVATEMTESEVYAVNGAEVTDGSLHLTLSKNDVDGTNWHTVQIKSVVIVAPVKPVADTYADFFVIPFEGDELAEFSYAELMIFDLVENVELSGEVHATLTTPTNVDGEILVASHYLDESIPEEPCHVITFEGTQVYTAPGAYTLTIPEGLFTVDGAPNAATVVNFTVMEPVVVEFEATIVSVTPAEGEVTELSEIIVQFDSDIVVPYSNVFVTNEDGTEFEFELDPNHSDYTQARYFAKDGAITAAGTYTFDCSQIDHVVNRLTRERIYPFTGAYTWTIKAGENGIDNINVDADAVIYDIHGRRVTEMTKGIYIVNGKKVIKK